MKVLMTCLLYTSHNFFVNRVEDLEDALREAFRIANSGRKGPVLVDITKDVTANLVEYKKQGDVYKRQLYKFIHSFFIRRVYYNL